MSRKYGLHADKSWILSGEKSYPCKRLDEYRGMYGLGKCGKLILQSIPQTYAFKSLRVYDTNGQSFTATLANRSNGECTYQGIGVDPSNGREIAFGFEDDIKQYAIKGSDFEFIILTRRAFVLKIAKSANFSID